MFKSEHGALHPVLLPRAAIVADCLVYGAVAQHTSHNRYNPNGGQGLYIIVCSYTDNGQTCQYPNLLLSYSNVTLHAVIF